MKIPAKELLAALEVCSVAPSDPVLESSQYVRVTQDGKQLQLSLTGALWAEANAKGTEGVGKWTAYVERRALKAFLEATNGNDVELLCKEKLIIKAGSRLEMALHKPINGYERWQPKTKHDISDELKGIITVGTKYLPKGDVGNKEVAAINVRKDYGVLATDTLFMCGFFGVPLPVDCLIPTTLAKFIAEADSGKLAVDGNGVGLALANGYAYEPLPSQLDKYPFKACQAQLENARKTPFEAVVAAKDLLDMLNAAAPFLVDKAESGLFASSKDGKSLLLTVPLSTGKFQQAVSVPSKSSLPETKWVFKKAIPFLTYINELDDDAMLEVVKPSGSLVLRYTEKPLQFVYLSADL